MPPISVGRLDEAADGEVRAPGTLFPLSESSSLEPYASWLRT